MEFKSWKENQAFSEERFTKQVLYRDKQHTNFVLNFLPGQTLPTHRHPGKDVFLLVLQGSGSCQIGEKTFSISDGDFIHLDDADEIGMVNDSDQPLSIYITLHNIEQRKEES